MRVIALVLVAAAGSGTAIAAGVTGARTVPCDESVQVTKWPYVGGPQPYRSRVVFAAVAVPPRFIPQVEPTRSARWPYFSKWGVVVRANAGPVTLTVPRAWRDRVAISWGNAQHAVFHTIRFAGCSRTGETGSAYAGGFFLRSRSACVPLIVRAGTRSAAVRFGLARSCR